jgi:hypothetical protein
VTNAQQKALNELDKFLAESAGDVVAAPTGWQDPPQLREEDDSKSRSAIEALRDTDYKDTDAHFKMVQLLKGLAAADDKLSEQFLSEVSDALTSAANKVLGGKKESLGEQADLEMDGADPEQYDDERTTDSDEWVGDVQAEMGKVQDVSQAFTDEDEAEAAIDTATALARSAAEIAIPNEAPAGETGTVDARTESIKTATDRLVSHLRGLDSLGEAFRGSRGRTLELVRRINEAFDAE